MEDPMIINNIDKSKALSEQARARLDSVKKSSGKMAGNEAIEKAAKEFEAVFLAQMMEHMFEGVDMMPGSDGPGQDIYKSMLIDEYSKLMAQSGGVGVADHVKREMIRMQEIGLPEQSVDQSAPETTNTIEKENTVKEEAL